MLSNAETSETLWRVLHLAQPPIAVCFARSVPAEIESWAGHAPAGCRFWQEAATHVFATSAEDHAFCSLGQYTHNLDMSADSASDLKDTLQVLEDLLYVREQDVPTIPVLAEKPQYVIYGPLGRISLAPDVVLLFVRPVQMLILTEASQQIENGFPPAMGRPACAVIPQVVNTGRSALSLGCCGARAYVDTLTEELALYAIPGARAGEFAERVEALARANELLGTFHSVRREQVQGGASPTVKESLAGMG